MPGGNPRAADCSPDPTWMNEVADFSMPVRMKDIARDPDVSVMAPAIIEPPSMAA